MSAQVSAQVGDVAEEAGVGERGAGKSGAVRVGADGPRRRGRTRLGAVGLGAVVAGAVTVRATPRPLTTLVRKGFDWDADRTTRALDNHAPAGVARIAGEQYRVGDPDALLDVYFPESAAEGAGLPTVVWTHGGGWVSGTRRHYNGYYQRLASEGYTVVSLDYSLGPFQQYPTAVHQLNAAHAYLVANAERLRVDPDKFILAGDSAGAQLSSQLATIITNPDYAREVGVTPALRPEQLRGVILNCGVYDMSQMASGGGILGSIVRQPMWAYTGDRDPRSSSALRQMSTLHRVTDAYPPAYISGGNGDPLTDAQSRPLAGRLASLGVDVTTLFYPADHRPKLPHEYQFNLDTVDGQRALQQTLDFMAKKFA